MGLNQPQQIEGKKKGRKNKQEIIGVAHRQKEHQKNKTIEVATHLSRHDVDTGLFSKLFFYPSFHSLTNGVLLRISTARECSCPTLSEW